MKEIFTHYYSQCRRNYATMTWDVPPTQDVWHLVHTFDWQNMLHDEALELELVHISSCMPTFYMGEADANKSDKPRLDILIRLNDGREVRYHQKAKNIWLPFLNEEARRAIGLRRERLIDLRARYHRDWEHDY